MHRSKKHLYSITSSARPSGGSGTVRAAVESQVGNRTDEISTQRYYPSVAAASAPRRARLWGKREPAR
jgi:hypothetical protein